MNISLIQAFKGPLARWLTMSFTLLALVAVVMAIGSVWVVRFTDNIAQVPENQRPNLRRYKEPDDYLTPEDRKRKEVMKALKTKKAETQASTTLSTAEKLNNEKADLDREHADLRFQKEVLTKKSKDLEGPEAVKEHLEQVKRLNERIAAYEQKRKIFQDEVDAFNTVVKSETSPPPPDAQTTEEESASEGLE